DPPPPQPAATKARATAASHHRSRVMSIREYAPQVTKAQYSRPLAIIPEHWPRSACSCQQLARSIQVTFLNQDLLWPTGHAVHAPRRVVRLTGTTRHPVGLKHPADHVRFDHIRDNSHSDHLGHSERRPACSSLIATARIATESTNHQR